jgi:hypothetical protein
MKCAGCGEEVDALAVFPGGICLECYKETDDAKRLLSAAELRRMWGIK